MKVNEKFYQSFIFLDPEFKDVGDEVDKFQTRLVINDCQVMSMEDQPIEWAEYKVQHLINKKVKGEKIKKIAVLGLKTSTAITNEFMDFLIRLA